MPSRDVNAIQQGSLNSAPNGGVWCSNRGRPLFRAHKPLDRYIVWGTSYIFLHSKMCGAEWLDVCQWSEILVRVADSINFQKVDQVKRSALWLWR